MIASEFTYLQIHHYVTYNGDTLHTVDLVLFILSINRKTTIISQEHT